MKSQVLLDIHFYAGTYEDFFTQVTDKIETKENYFVATPNPEMLYEASQNDELRNILKNTDENIPDGAGIFVAYQKKNSHLPRFLHPVIFPWWCLRAIIHDRVLKKNYGERITGSRLVKDLLLYADKNTITITIIDPVVHGNTPWDEAKKISQKTMKETLSKQYPNIPFNIIISDSVLTEIPYGIVFCTHGNGKQEKLLSDIRKNIPHYGLLIGVWGSIDLITGFRSPAPVFFQRFGGEWLYRLWKNPRKHYKRMKKVVSFLISI